MMSAARLVSSLRWSWSLRRSRQKGRMRTRLGLSYHSWLLMAARQAFRAARLIWW